MTITVLYFAAIRQIVGRAEDSLALPPGVTTIAKLAEHLERSVPGLEGRLGAVRWAQNEEFAELAANLEDGDVVALIPPVAGGSR